MWLVETRYEWRVDRTRRIMCKTCWQPRRRSRHKPTDFSPIIGRRLHSTKPRCLNVHYYGSLSVAFRCLIWWKMSIYSFSGFIRQWFPEGDVWAIQSSNAARGNQVDWIKTDCNNCSRHLRLWCSKLTWLDRWSVLSLVMQFVDWTSANLQKTRIWNFVCKEKQKWWLPPTKRASAECVSGKN